MIKQVTCARSTVERAATAKGIRLASHNLDHDADVLVRELQQGGVVVHGRTLAGQLFLSLLVAGAF